MKITHNLKTPFLLVLAVYMRYRWSTISQWREDSATNIWLAYTKNLSELPVGLLSSKMIPTPNGIVIFGKIFTIFESLLFLTFFLSIIQVVLFYFLSKEVSTNKNLRIFIFSLLSFSTLLSSSSVEFWNNHFLILVNSIFFIFLFKFLNSEKSELIIILICLVTLPPAIYLAGLSNSIVFLLLIFLSLFMNKNYQPIGKKFLYFFVAVTYLFLNYLFIWRPYFNNVKISQVFGFSNLTLYDRLNIFSDNFLQIPGSFLTIWTNKTAFYINQIEVSGITNVNSTYVHEIFKIFVEFHKIIIVLFVGTTLLGVSKLINSDQKIDGLLAKKVFLFFVFITTSILINPILGGPNFINLERPENLNQYYPFFLLVLLLTPFVFSNIGVFKNKIIFPTYTIFSLFILINIVLSFSVFSNSLNYDGDKLTEADVPLIHKIELVDFIGQSLRENNNNSTTISYFLGGGRWDWIPTHGEYFSEWYTDNPFTMGRVYDYQLYRKFSIINEYEGIIRRDFYDSDFIVTYKFENHRVLNNTNYDHFYFGRLRLSKLVNK